MGEYVRDLGDDAPVVTLDLLSAKANEILANQLAEKQHRRWTLAFTIGGALFAAVRLGIIAIPRFRRSRSSRTAGDLVANPRRVRLGSR